MKVIIIKTGEVNNVSAGYARNYLLPRGLAILATPQAEQEAASKKRQHATQVARDEQEFVELGKKLGQLSILVSAKANEDGTLFGALKVSAIIKALQQAGVAVKEQWLVYDKPIKKIGEHSLILRFNPQAQTNFKIKVEHQK